ncbi:MAG TPA: DNA gyrase inhibitor YacG [Rhodospirillaceae bacterium]|nr:DNA gyrase inhibitor YacG [Rhodospirillaceae bacterium]
MVAESKAVCPICGKPAVAQSRPFCSPRCSRIDLGRWLGEVYRVPGDEMPPPAAGGERDDD